MALQHSSMNTSKWSTYETQKDSSSKWPKIIAAAIIISAMMMIAGAATGTYSSMQAFRIKRETIRHKQHNNITIAKNKTTTQESTQERIIT